MRLERQSGKHRILVYGAPKGGKTRLVTSLPYDKWGDAIYVAADMGSEALAGVLPQAIEHLRIEGFDRAGDLHQQAMSIACKKWAEEEGVGIIIWDTLTQTAQDLLRHYPRIAPPGKRVQQGVGDLRVVQPDKPDYGMAQATCDAVVRFLFQQDLHVIVVCHQDFATPGAGDFGGIIGGPATVGSAQIKDFARPFTSALHLESTRDGSGKINYKVFTKPHAIWQAGVRTVKPLDDQVLSENPVDFWEKFINATEGVS